MWIRTLPVYSKLAEPETVPPEVAARLPEGWRLSQHQVETYRALTEGDAEVIFNTAMTGDGKSLAGQLPVLLRAFNAPLLAMYPTNELVRDQRRQFQSVQQGWNNTSPVDVLDSARLDEIMGEEDYHQRGDALMSVLRNNDVVLTNPDIFHLIMHQFYLRPQDASDRILGPMVQRYRQFTFDEFHVFDTPQVVSVLNALLFIQTMAGAIRPHKSLCLSATPNPLMLEYLRRSGLQVQEIAGVYAHAETPPDPGRWRQVLQQSTIHFEASRVEEWVEQHLHDTLLPFFLERRPGAKGAIIVNSIATAMRLLKQLQPAFAAHGLSVEPNTGLTSRERRAVSYAADLLVGTSTVDVGIDFQINFLLFESRDAGTFTQRLGRLGRHTEYKKNGVSYPFSDFVAYALVPSWVHEGLFVGRDGAPALLQDTASVQRDHLNAAIVVAYPSPCTFDQYAQTWGQFQSVRILRGLSSRTVKEQYAPTRIQLGRRYEETFGIQLRPALGRYLELERTQQGLLDEASSFRGGSYLTCAIMDETETGPAQFKTADLLQLVANANLELVDEEDFYRAVERSGCLRCTLERQQPLAYFRLRGWHNEHEDCVLILDRDMQNWGAEQFERAILQQGFHVDAHVPGLARLNSRLCRREIPAFFCAGYHPQELKRRLRLPMLFALFKFRSRDGVEGCVALGREALLLEVRARAGLLKKSANPIIL